MNRGDRLYNRKVEQQRREENFPRNFKMTIGAILLAAFIAVFCLFAGTVRSCEQGIRYLNQK